MCSCKNHKTEVMIIGTLHGFHQDNNFYSYENIFQIVEEFNPDLLGVEIRPEDVSQPREYLEMYYPYEMIEAAFRFSKATKIVGFDWLGTKIEGKLIPERYFINLRVKTLEKKFVEDNTFIKERKALEINDQVRLNLIKDRTSSEVNDGKYDIASKIYYGQLEILLEDTEYEDMSTFYRERDKNIDKNINEILENNQGKRLAFIMGCDHRVFAIDAIKEKFGDSIRIIPTP